MASARQFEANRLNAQNSTGPRTPEGKARSSRNAVTHGLTARKVFLAEEDPEEYRRLHEAAAARLKPEGVLEDELVARLVSLIWRLRRIPAFEAALLAWLEQQKEEEEDASMLNLFSSPRRADLELGRTIKRFLSADFSGKLSRYEMSLQKQLFALLQELRSMQERRLRESEARISENAETA